MNEKNEKRKQNVTSNDEEPDRGGLLGNAFLKDVLRNFEQQEISFYALG